MYAIFDKEDCIQEVESGGYRFACIFRSEQEAEKIRVVLSTPDDFKIKKVKVF